jgi:hypothetical protein
MRTVFKGAFLLVEGEDDAKVFAQFVDVRSCEIYSCDGKDAVLEALARSRDANVVGVLCVVDSDYWNIDQARPSDPDLTVTDCHDFELLIVRSNAFLKVARELCSQPKVKGFLAASGFRSIRSGLLSRTGIVGALRWLNHTRGLGLSFAKVDLGRHVVRATLAVNGSKYINALLNASKSRISPAKLERDAESILAEGHDLYQLCSGHDVAVIMALGLRKAIGNHDHRVGDPDHVRATLRMAFDSRHFAATNLYAEIKGWEARNSGYRVLAF